MNENALDIPNDFMDKFIATYPEFKPLFNKNPEAVNNLNSTYLEVLCFYPEFSDYEKNKCEFYPLACLVAHYFVMSGFASSIGILAQRGLTASSSVGDVSVSFQASPYSTKGNDFTYYLSLTPYGMKYIAWLQRKEGLTYVN